MPHKMIDIIELREALSETRLSAYSYLNASVADGGPTVHRETKAKVGKLLPLPPNNG